MKLELDFSDLDAPRLTQTTYRTAPDAPPVFTMDSTGAQIDRRPDLLLMWSRGTKAVCLLLLRWKTGDASSLTGRSGSARTAFDFVRKCIEDENNDHPLARVFGEWANVAKIFRHFGSNSSTVGARLLDHAANKLTLIVRAIVAGGLHELKVEQCRARADRIAAQLDRSAADRDPDAEAADAPLSARVELLLGACRTYALEVSSGC